jgi:hypothetical protein
MRPYATEEEVAECVKDLPLSRSEQLAAALAVSNTAPDKIPHMASLGSRCVCLACQVEHERHVDPVRIIIRCRELAFTLVGTEAGDALMDASVCIEKLITSAT